MVPHITTLISTQVATAQPHLDALMLFGFLAAIAALACYVNRHQSRSVSVALAVCLAATAAYGFLQGAWPLGIIQGAWAIMTFQQCFGKKSDRKQNNVTRQFTVTSPQSPWQSESRVSRLFGPR